MRGALLLTLNSAASHAAKPAEAVTITLNREGGSGGPTELSVAKDDAMPTLTSLPTKSGYAFGGYYTAASGGGSQIYRTDGTPAKQVSTFTANTILYAYWLPKRTITLDNQGATTAGTTSISIAIGENLPNITPPVKANYWFVGYYTEVNGGGTQIYNSVGTGSTSTFTQDTTLYAYWMPFVDPDISNFVQSELPYAYANPSSYLVTDSDINPYPWTVKGGYLVSTNQGVADSVSSFSLNVCAQENTTLTISYKSKGEEGCDCLMVLINDELFVPDVAGGMDEFAEWVLDIPSGYTLLEFVYFKDSDIDDDEDCAYIESIIIGTGQSASSMIALTLDKQGGSGYADSIVYSLQGDFLPYIRPPTKTGYMFEGYYTGTNRSGTKIYDADGTPWFSTSTLTANTTLYAYWAVPTITLDNQGATTAGTTSISIAGGENLPTITPPTKTGYKFGGYYTSTNGSGTKIYNADGTPAISTSTFTANTTIYAYWTDWYVIANVSGSTTSITQSYTTDDDKKSVALTLVLTPASGNIISEFSFDNVEWYTVKYFRYDIANTSEAIGVVYYANENSNGLVLEFKGIITDSAIKLYFKTTAGAYSGLKTAGGAEVNGVAVQSTYGGVAMVVGANFEGMSDDDIIICSTMACDGYKFMYWIDGAGNKLSYDESAKFKKSEVYGSILTAVFAPIENPNINLETDNT